MSEEIRFTLNGAPVLLRTDPRRRLLDVLRDDFGLVAAKEGCGEGECGACSVLVDHRLANSCLLPILALEGRDVLTLEGFRGTERFGILKACFEEAGSVQCGYCTPGMILAAEALLSTNPDPTEAQVREGLSGNLCRCTGYAMIVDAVLAAARQGVGAW